MAKRIGKYKVSGKEDAIYQHDIDFATPSTLSITGNSSFATDGAAKKIGFHGVTAIAQQSTIADPTISFTAHTWDGASVYPTAAQGDEIVADLASIKAKVAAIIDALQGVGLIA